MTGNKPTSLVMTCTKKILQVEEETSQAMDGLDRLPKELEKFVSNVKHGAAKAALKTNRDDMLDNAKMIVSLLKRRSTAWDARLADLMKLNFANDADFELLLKTRQKLERSKAKYEESLTRLKTVKPYLDLIRKLIEKFRDQDPEHSDFLESWSSEIMVQYKQVAPALKSILRVLDDIQAAMSDIQNQIGE